MSGSSGSSITGGLSSLMGGPAPTSPALSGMMRDTNPGDNLPGMTSRSGFMPSPGQSIFAGGSNVTQPAPPSSASTPSMQDMVGPAPPEGDPSAGWLGFLPGVSMKWWLEQQAGRQPVIPPSWSGAATAPGGFNPTPQAQQIRYSPAPKAAYQLMADPSFQTQFPQLAMTAK